jgi:hypothetical protein
MKRQILVWVTLVVLAIAVAAPALAHHQPEFGNLRDKVKRQADRIASLESYVLDLNGRICALETESGGPDPGEGCPG